MARKKLESWLLWIAVDIVATIYYFKKGIYLVGIEYIIFGIIALAGYLNWRKIHKSYLTKQEVNL